MTRDEIPEPVTKSDDALERILAEVDVPPETWERILAETDVPPDVWERILSETPPLDLSDLPDLAAVTDLVDLDRLLAETAVPLDDATVIGTVAEVLGRD